MGDSEEERIDVRSFVAGAQAVGGVSEKGVRTPSHDDIDVQQLHRQLLLEVDPLHMRQQDDLVDALANEHVHLMLDNRRQLVDVITGRQEGDSAYAR